MKDSEVEETTTVHTEKSKTEVKKKKKEAKTATEFKVLGVGDFEKKTKVNCTSCFIVICI